MGEKRAVRESISSLDGTNLGTEYRLSINSNFVCLGSLQADNPIYVHNYAFGYNKCKPGAILEEALMFKNKSINGEITYAC